MRTVIRLFTMSQLFDHLLHFAYRQYTVEPDRMMTCDRCQPVPLQIRNAPTRLMKELDYGKGYQYAHDTADKLTDMQCLPDALLGREYYRPTEQGVEGKFKARLEQIKDWKKKQK